LITITIDNLRHKMALVLLGICLHTSSLPIYSSMLVSKYLVYPSAAVGK